MFDTMPKPNKKAKKIYRSKFFEVVADLCQDVDCKSVNKKSKIIINTLDGEIQLLSIYWDSKGNLNLDVGEDYSFNKS